MGRQFQRDRGVSRGPSFGSPPLYGMQSVRVPLHGFALYPSGTQ
jgi:hypothetical protein